MSDTEFEPQADSGASKTYPKQCSALRKGEHVMMKGHACKIVDMSTSKTGKHGHAKVHLVGLDIFDGKKYEDICPSTHNMEVPHVKREEFPVVDMDEDGYLSIMTTNSEVREDIKVDKDSTLWKEIREMLDNGKEPLVTVINAIGTESPMSCKEVTANQKK